MKYFLKTRILFAFLGVLAFIAFTQCNKMEEEQDSGLEFGGGGSSAITGGGGQTAAQKAAIKNGFANTVHSVLKSSQYNCVGCHGSSQAPMHGHENVETAMNEFLSFELIDVANPAASRILDKVAVERHNCAPKCDELTTNLSLMLSNWAEVILANQGDNDGNSEEEEPEVVCNPTTIPLTVVTGETGGGTGLNRRQAFDQEVFPVMQGTVCANCHLSARTPLHSSNNANIAYAAWEDNNLADFQIIDNSFILQQIAGGHRGYDAQSDVYFEVRNAIVDWREAIDPNAGQQGGMQTTYSREYELCDSYTEKIESINGIDEGGGVEITGGSFGVNQATIIAPMVLQNDFIQNPNAHPLYNVFNTNGGKARYEFEVYESSDIEVIAEVSSVDGLTDSMFAAIKPRGEEPANNNNDYTEWHFGNTGGEFEAIAVRDQATGVQKVWSLTSGSYTLTFKERENFARLRNVVIKRAGQPLPAGGDTAKLMRYDLQPALGVSGAELTFLFAEYDESSYIISDVRIKGAPFTYVENMKIYINDRFFPGNATFTLVDHLVLTNNDKISQASMIMLKVNGMGDVQDTDPVTGDPLVDGSGNPVYKPADVLSIGFDILVPTTER